MGDHDAFIHAGMEKGLRPRRSDGDIHRWTRERRWRYQSGPTIVMALAALSYRCMRSKAKANCSNYRLKQILARRSRLEGMLQGAYASLERPDYLERRTDAIISQGPALLQSIQRRAPANETLAR